MNARRHLSLRLLTALAVSALPLAATAQPYPSRPISIVVGVPPGGTIDTLTRIVAESMSARLSVPVVVQNRPGAAGAIAAEAVLAAEPDGYTLLAAFPTYTSLPVVRKSLKFDFLKDFLPIGIFAETPFVLFTGTKPASSTSAAELIELARRAKPSLTYGSADVTTQLAGAQLVSAVGVEAVHVPYRGGSPMVVDIIGGRVDFGFLGVASIRSQALAGQLRPLAIAHHQRLRALPDVPTLDEAGVRNVQMRPWVGLVTSSRVDPAIAGRLEKAVSEALASAEVVMRLTDLGAEPVFTPGAKASARFAQEAELFRALGAAVGIVAE